MLFVLPAQLPFPLLRNTSARKQKEDGIHMCLQIWAQCDGKVDMVVIAAGTGPFVNSVIVCVFGL